MEQHELDPGRSGSLCGCASFGHADVVELAHGRVARSQHLAIAVLVVGPHVIRGLALCLGEHHVAPGPEVAAGRAAAQGALERVAVSVHEAGDAQRARHVGDATRGDAGKWT